MIDKTAAKSRPMYYKSMIKVELLFLKEAHSRELILNLPILVVLRK
jgi:hypothetical protein